MSFNSRTMKDWDPLKRQAYYSYKAQKERCTNKNSKNYSNYGGMGVTVKYGLHEFIEWYLHELKKHPTMISPTVGRINHEDHYTFNNIKMQSRSDNSKERSIRKPMPSRDQRKKIVVIDRETGAEIAIFNSQDDCRKTLGVSAAHISSECHKMYHTKRRKRDKRFMFSFKFVDEK